ncbi:glycosyltransferase family 4 protein [Catellatospora sp. KI3]|uniref:glycosyltransferase family 4 protein n=1 Tax=Catellatospora sp. KI3 TaxID=3041620 RepID=UPI002482B82D|nr:glycosyltransferase family 4 protein [Catellatospora sp. KI3]MDI1463412.1 glycosyltransferase family 4 protein [Catellatospora sp. KI3]
MTTTAIHSDLSAKAPQLPDGPAAEAEPLKIAMVAPPYFTIPPVGYGGIEAVVADLSDALTAAGHQVTLIAAGANGTRAGFRPVWDRTVPERLGEPGPEIIYAAEARRVVEALAAEGAVDVVHDHTFAGVLNAPAYARLGLPTVATMHGPADSELRGFYRALGDDVPLVAISRRQQALAPELSWIDTVHNGLDPAAWPYQARKGEYALFLGRFSPDKGAHTAVLAARAAGLPLILAGKCAEPAERKYFREQVEPLLGPNDQMIGPADGVRKRELFANARCLLFPIQWEEPFGMVMIESMICGTPVVALRAGAVPEVVSHGVSGLICDDPEQLPEALREVSALDPADCRRHVVHNFSAAHMAVGYARAYRRALAALEATAAASAHPQAARSRTAPLGLRRAGSVPRLSGHAATSR